MTNRTTHDQNLFVAFSNLERIYFKNKNFKGPTENLAGLSPSVKRGGFHLAPSGYPGAEGPLLSGMNSHSGSVPVLISILFTTHNPSKTEEHDGAVMYLQLSRIGRTVSRIGRRREICTLYN